MALTLYVDGPRWRSHLARVVQGNPGIVPVAKGNGYGLGLDRLVGECARLAGEAGLDMMAVGTYAEAPVALAAFPGDVLVLEPYRARLQADLPVVTAPALVHTVTSPADLADLEGRMNQPRVVLEALTSMNRHGMTSIELIQTLADMRSEGAGEAAALVGVTLHLPLGHGHVEEIERWLAALDEVQVPCWLLSHVSGPELAELGKRHPDKDFRPRIGTALWLGDDGALSVRAQVLDVRSVRSGDRAGYRQRRLSAGHLLVLSGGTAHGVGMQAPSAAATLRQRLIALGQGALEAAGRVRSPFTVGGRRAWFVEPPHMHVSLVSVPDGVSPPEVGDEVQVRVRHTTVHPDCVVFT